MNLISAPDRPSLLRPIPEDEPDEALDVAALGSRIIGMAGRLAAATCRWLLLLAEFDAREGYTKFNLWSSSRWLTHYCGLSRRTALEHLRVAKALKRRPALVASMSAGRLSYSQVRAISRIDDIASDSLIDELINIAENGTVGQLEVIIRGLRTVDDNESDEIVPDKERVTRRWGYDSRLHITARLDPENGALVQSAIETIARAEGITLAAALTRMAKIALAAVNAEGTAPRLRGDERAAVLIHVDASAVPADEDGVAGDSEPRSRERARPFARIADGAGLPRRVIDRLLCSGRIRTVVRDGTGNVLDVGRTRRLVTDKQFRALVIRQDGRCGSPGCRSRKGLEAHHVRPWLYGGRTDMDNLVLLCEAHHHAFHDGAFRIEPRGRGRFGFFRLDGNELPQHVDPSTLVTRTTAIEDEYADIRDNAPTTRWDGQRPDYDYAISVLASAAA